MPEGKNPNWRVWALAAALALCLLLALAVGSVSIAPGEVAARCFDALRGRARGDALDRIILDARLPRVLLAAAVGSALALAGLAAQNLFRNPLAGPHVIGVSSGAALGAVAAMLFAGAAGWAVAFWSMAGGLAVGAAVFFLARTGRQWGYSLLLAGIALGTLCSALTTGALYIAGERLQTIIFWLMGGFWRANWSEARVMLPLAVAAAVALRLMAPAMNVAVLGERSAEDTGVNVRRLQFGLLAVAVVPTSVAVSLAGVIGFVGLIAPHMVRLIIGNDHRALVPGCAFAGALLLAGADAVARTAAAPAEIPVGLITAILGAPLFLWLLLRRAGEGRR